MSRAEHLRGQPVPATIRFANASGDPNVHDGQPNVRSMAVKLQVAGGKPADILANSIEGFVARTPEELLAFLEAQLPDPATGKPVPDAVPRFLESHPGSPKLNGTRASLSCWSATVCGAPVAARRIRGNTNLHPCEAAAAGLRHSRAPSMRC